MSFSVELLERNGWIEAYNNIVILTKMHQVTAFSCLKFKKVQFCMQKFEIKNVNFDCEVFKKPNVTKLHHRTRESFPVPTMMIC